MLVYQFARVDEKEQANIYRHYLSHSAYINNWDLVDGSAPHIVGAYLLRRVKQPIYQLAKSESLWERRIAIMATLHFIKHNEFHDALNISEILLTDGEDLIHKAVGWMLP